MHARWLLAAVVIALVAAACGTAPAPQQAAQPTATPVAVPTDTPIPEPVQLTYFTFSAAPDHLEDLDAIIQAFQAENPGIRVKVETAPFDEYFTKLQTLVAGGTAPDVFELNYENFVSYASRAVLLDLTPYAEADAGFDPEVFYPRAYQAFQHDGKQYGLSESFSDVILFYNQDLFDEAGVEYPQADWTWDDAIAAAKELTKPDEGVWGLYSGIHFWEYYKKAAQFGCSFFNEDQTSSTLDAPACTEALEFMIGLVDEHGVMPSDAQMGGLSDGDLFNQGKLAMWVVGIWMFTPTADAPFAWDIQLEPGGPAGKAHHFFSNGVVASKTTQHPEAAWKWIRFLTSSPQAAKVRVAASWELPALQDETLFGEWLEQSPPESREVVFQALETLVTPPVIERQNEMQDTVNGLIQKAKEGELSPAEALAQAKDAVDALLKE